MEFNKQENSRTNKSLFRTLIFWFLLLSLVPMIITSWVNYQQAKQSLVAASSDKLYQGSEHSHQFINNWFAYRMMDTNGQSQTKANINLLNSIIEGWKKSDQVLKSYVKSQDWLMRVGDLQADIIGLRKHYDYIYDIYLIDTKGNILYSIKNNLGGNVKEGLLAKSQFAESVSATIKTKKTQFSDIERYAHSGDMLSGFISAPIVDNSGEILGLFSVQLRLDRIFSNIGEIDENHTSLAHYLVGEDGVLRSPIHRNFDDVLAQKIETQQFKRWHQEHTFKNAVSSFTDDQKEVVFEYQGPSGKAVFGVHQLVVINNIRWVLISEIDSDEVLQTSFKMAEAVLVVLFFSIMIITIIVIVQVKRITRPLQKLSIASSNVAKGEYNQQVDIETNNEIGQLAHAFNNMVSKQQQNEQMIKNSNEQLRNTLIELSSQQYALDQHAIVGVTDINGIITFVNDKFCEVSGYDHDTLIGRTHKIVNSGIHDKIFFKEMYKTINSGHVWHGQICNRHKSGRVYWVETTIAPYKNDQGVILQYVAIRTDITKQKNLELQQEAQLKTAAIKLDIAQILSQQGTLSEHLIKALLHLFDIPDLPLTSKACLYGVNDQHECVELLAKIGDFLDSELESKKWIIAQFDQAASTRSVIHLSDCNETYCHEKEAHDHYIVPLFNILNKDNYDCNALIGALLLYAPKGVELNDEKIQLLGEISDIFTNAILRTHANELLKKATEIALQNSQIKGDFLASMSHEIRTPMNGVLGMLGLLLNSSLSHEQKHKALLAKSSAESLLILINDILDFSKVEAGKMELNSIDFNLRDMLGEVSESMALRAQEKGLEIILDVTQIDHSMVKGDSGRIRQIITNLLGNSVKFTDVGEIKISVDVQEIDNDSLRLNCSIQDTGIGIPENKIAQLFEMFMQVDASTTRKYGGTGLGLAICKKLSNLMGGDIKATSQLGVGSTFMFTAKLEKSIESQRVLPQVDISKLNILIVDDNCTNIEVLRGQLEQWGATVTEATSGKEALEICYDRASLQPDFFDVAILDMQMPEMDGAQLGKALRSDKQFDAMKLVMMTSIASLNENKYFTDLGFNAYFPKPATTTDLFGALSVVVDNESDDLPLVTHDFLASLAPSKETKDSIKSALKPLNKDNVRILLVEDNKVNQMVALGILEELGFTADLAENGQIALDMLKKAPLNSPYQLIYMDCQMPIIDGYEATKLIRLGEAGEQYSNVTIIAMTANAMEGDREKCLNVGMDDYIGKPIDPKILEDKLYYWLQINSHRTISEAVESPGSLTREEALPPKEIPVCWHKESALHRLLNKESLLISLINIFIEEIPNKISLLGHEIDNKNHQEVGLIAHTIKGAAANLSAIKLSHYCFELEKSAKVAQASDYQKIYACLNESYSDLMKTFNVYLHEKASAVKSDSKQKQGLSYKASFIFLEKLSVRLQQNDYIAEEELIALIESDFDSATLTKLKLLKNMINLFDFSNADIVVKDLLNDLSKNNEEGNV